MNEEETIFGDATFDFEPCIFPAENSASDTHLTYADVAAHWKCSERYVKKLKAQGRLIPEKNLGRLVRFTRKELERCQAQEHAKRKKR